MRSLTVSKAKQQVSYLLDGLILALTLAGQIYDLPFRLDFVFRPNKPLGRVLIAVIALSISEGILPCSKKSVNFSERDVVVAFSTDLVT